MTSTKSTDSGNISRKEVVELLERLRTTMGNQKFGSVPRGSKWTHDTCAIHNAAISYDIGLLDSYIKTFKGEVVILP